MTASLFDEFERLAAAVLDGTATGEETHRFNAVLREFPELASVYFEQARMHAMLECGGGGRFGVQAMRTSFLPPAADGGSASKINVRPARARFAFRGAATRVQPSCASLSAGDEPGKREESWRASVPASRCRSVWRVAAAAAVAVLLGGVAIWQSVSLFSGVADCRLPTADASVPPVTLVSQSGVRGLDLPDALPGTVRLSAGEAVVRLRSGVRLTVLGPASLEVRDNMQVALEQGRLLADVPHWATGFLVRTADLDVYDLGTVFSVSVDWPVSDVFVFKGRVRVNESGHGERGDAISGEEVGICEAGEGVRAEAGERPVKFAADWPAARKVFASIWENAATANPAEAFAFAEKIADLWSDGCLSRELSRVAARRLATASAPQIPFRKTAWVRPAAPAKEASNMNKASAAAVLAAAAMTMGTGTASGFSEAVAVNTSPVRNLRWSTVYTNAIPLAWNWPANAAGARLEIVGMNGTYATNVTTAVSNCLWQAFASSAPSSEDVYDLTLTFLNSGDAVVGALTSRLAVVTGAFGETAVDPGPSERKWTKVKDNTVIPYDAGWAEATASATNSRLVIAKDAGVTQINALADASGYYGWKIKRSDWGYGTFHLALTFPGTVTNAWDAVLTRVMDGTLIRMQ